MFEKERSGVFGKHHGHAVAAIFLRHDLVNREDRAQNR